MLRVLLYACILVAATVAVHASGMVLMLGALRRSHARPPARFWPIMWLLVRLAWWLIVIHLAEITVWGLFYRGAGCLPDLESALYFSGVTYTTVGYGELLLAKPWRLLGPIEALTGILMCGLSAGLFFAVVSRIYAPHFQTARTGSQAD